MYNLHILSYDDHLHVIMLRHALQIGSHTQCFFMHDQLLLRHTQTVGALGIS